MTNGASGSAQPVLWEKRGSIGLVTVNRPDAMNALNKQVLELLETAFLELSRDDGCRAIVMTGQGERAFVSGADIHEFVGATPADALVLAARIRRVTRAMTNAPQPIVAAIRGYCLGGGLELALACDIRLAGKGAKLGLPEIKLGILPGGGGTVRLTKVAGSSIARLLSMIGDPIDAERAYAAGLLASLHEDEEVLGAAEEIAARLAAYSPFALAQLKSSLNIAIDADTDAACDAEIKAFALCYSTQDQEEGASAFLEKRKPVFTGR